MPRKLPVVIRPAVAQDLPTLGRLGAALAGAHHDWDPKRFFIVDSMEEGYAWWLGRELKNRRAVVLAAVRSGRVIGYAYGRIEPRDWNALRDTCGVGIDLIVSPRARGAGVGKRLAEELIHALQAKGAPRIVLYAAARNREAQRFFRALGCRPTMIEMALELAPPEPAPRGRPRKRP